MSVFRSRPVMRWLVPSAAAVAVIGGGAAAGVVVASADPSLPERSAAQLLVDLQNAKVDGFSGTIVQTADLGLQKIPALSSGSGQQGADIAKLITGNNTVRVWYAGEDKARLAMLGVLGETDIIRNGNDVWLWRSQPASATHLTIPAGTAEKKPLAPTSVPSTPQEAADAALAAIDPTTSVTTTGAAEVAGRDAYELVLAPRDTDSLVGQVRLAVDAEHHIPLRVDVYAKGAANPAVRVAFQQISFTVPDAEQFKFTPPPGTKVETPSELKDEAEAAHPGKGEALDKSKAPGADDGKVIGKGWTTILTTKLPAAKGTEANALEGVIDGLPAVKGTWGSGHLFAGTLFSVLVTDDGRVLAGAVPPEKLYAAAVK